MTELIKLEDREGQQVVNARELHSFLEVGKKFADWIHSRINKYGFVEGLDFFPFLGKSTTGRPLKEYRISLDMAKELAMVENNQRGREVRRYFIEVEQKAREVHEQTITLNPRGLMLIEQNAQMLQALGSLTTAVAGLIENQQALMGCVQDVLGSLQQLTELPKTQSREKRDLATSGALLPSIERSHVRNRVEALASRSKFSIKEIYSYCYDHVSKQLPEVLRSQFWQVRHGKESSLQWLEDMHYLELMNEPLAGLESWY